MDTRRGPRLLLFAQSDSAMTGADDTRCSFWERLEQAAQDARLAIDCPRFLLRDSFHARMRIQAPERYFNSSLKLCEMFKPKAPA
jgi:hypothetical protein